MRSPAMSDYQSFGGPGPAPASPLARRLRRKWTLLLMASVAVILCITVAPGASTPAIFSTLTSRSMQGRTTSYVIPHPGVVGLSRRQHKTKIHSDASTAMGPNTKVRLETEIDRKGRKRIAYRASGWNKWRWKGNNINYIQSGEEGTPILFVHGFGAHAYHWRYQIPELSKKHRVYSLCLLGYGWSDKSTTAPYSAEFWATQVADFIRDVIGEKTVLVGNSIGAVTSLAAAAQYPDLVNGLVMVNAAGKFGDMEPDKTGELKPKDPKCQKKNPFVKAAEEFGKDVVASGIFYSTRFRIPQILKQVYADKDQVDDDLIKSISSAALDPNALGTFQGLYRAPFRGGLTVNKMMSMLPQDMRVLLLWGQQDPWMQPEKADQIMKVCDQYGLQCDYVPLDAGHCPQDDNPTALNENLMSWTQTHFP